MINTKSLKLMSTVFVVSALLVGCGDKAEQSGADTGTGTETQTQTESGTEKETSKENESKENEMKYIEKEELKEAIDSDSKEYIILDVRKAEDYNKAHVKGAYTADQDAANKGGDDAKGIENLKVALKEATGEETGNTDSKYALVCYSGKSYAQKATDLMLEMGISADQIYTLQGGMKAWESGGDEYKELLK